MAGAKLPPSTLRFDQYEVELRTGRLFKHGVRIGLRDKSFRALLALLEQAGEVVTREQLRGELWPTDVFVDFDNNLNTVIARLRQVLRDSAEHPRFIETVGKHGYRFLATVTASAPTVQPGPTPRARIVVLPFLNLGNDPTQEYFNDALTDEIITALAALASEHVAVIARTTAMYYKGRHKDVAHIRRELRVDYLVEGGVRRTEDQIWINIQLIQTGDQTHLFAKKYDAPSHEIFELQNRIAQDLAAHIPAIPDEIRAAQPGGDRVIRKPTEDLVAYNFYLQGRQQVQHGTPDPATVAAKAKRYFEDAIARDPNFALAHAALADGYWWIGFLGLRRPKEAFSAGVGAALRAIEIDPSLGFPHALLGVFRSLLDYNWAEADREFALALQLDPRCPETRFHYGGYLLSKGQIQEAIAQFEPGVESDPLSLYIRFWLGYSFYVGREYARAVEQFQFLIELAPNRHPEMKRALDLGYTGLGLVRAAEGRLDEAVSALRKAVELSRGVLMRLGQLGSVLARSGNTTEARRLLDRAQTMAAESYFPPACMGWIYLALGDIDAGFAWLERAVDDRDPNVLGINTDPLMVPLRAHPRFSALLRKMNLEP